MLLKRFIRTVIYDDDDDYPETSFSNKHVGIVSFIRCTRPIYLFTHISKNSEFSMASNYLHYN